jgi:zeta-carotene desaturase
LLDPDIAPALLLSAGCYFNLFRLMAKCGVLENLLLKDHTHTFINKASSRRFA